MQMKRIAGNRKTLPTTIGLVLVASFTGMTACSNDTEDVTLDSDDGFGGQ